MNNSIQQSLKIFILLQSFKHDLASRNSRKNSVLDKVNRFVFRQALLAFLIFHDDIKDSDIPNLLSFFSI